MTSLSFVAYAGDGTTGPFSVPFSYLDKAHVAVSVDGVPVGFSWTTDSAVALDVAAAVDALIDIRRITPRDQRLVDFTDGSVLLEADLDLGFLQQLYIAQEVVDAVENSVRLAADGAHTASGRRITTLADPIAAQDAATKGYVDAAAGVDAPGYAAAAAASAAAAAASAAAADVWDPEHYYTEAEADTLFAALDHTHEKSEIVDLAAATEAEPGLVRKSSSAENEAGVASDVFPDVAGVREMIEEHAPLSVAPGSVLWFAADAPPSGWLECDGAELSRSTYAELFVAIGEVYGAGDGVDTFLLPDLRGEFIRGWDNGAGADPGRSLGSFQEQEFLAHSHPGSGVRLPNAGSSGVPVLQTGGGSNSFSDPSRLIMASDGGDETRPRNVALMACIKF